MLTSYWIRYCKNSFFTNYQNRPISPESIRICLFFFLFFYEIRFLDKICEKKFFSLFRPYSSLRPPYLNINEIVLANFVFDLYLPDQEQPLTCQEILNTNNSIRPATIFKESKKYLSVCV